MKFSELIEAKSFFQDLTGATKECSRKSNSLKYFTFRDYTDDEKKEFGEKQTQGKKWEIVDKATPDYKTIFPILQMITYSGGDYKANIEVKWALADIAKGKWAPEGNMVECESLSEIRDENGTNVIMDNKNGRKFMDKLYSLIGSGAIIKSTVSGKNGKIDIPSERKDNSVVKLSISGKKRSENTSFAKGDLVELIKIDDKNYKISNVVY